MVITPKQMEWLEALADREPIDFAAINQAALSHLSPICRRWLPDGAVHGHEFVARNPIRHDKNAGSFRVNLVTGKWADFALWDVERPAELVCRIGFNPLHRRVRHGIAS